MRLSPNFTLSEFTRSATATVLGLCTADAEHCQEPPPEHLANIQEAVTRLYQPIRDRWGVMYVLSGYRGEAVNAALDKASPTSAHTVGYAADVRFAYAKPMEVARWLATSREGQRLAFDQVIVYASHLHLGYRHPSGEQRREFRRAASNGRFPPLFKGGAA